MTVSDPVAPPAGAGAEHRMLSRRFMLRTGGLPIETLRSLRCPESREAAEELLREEEALRHRGADLSDRLAPLVKELTDDGMRRRLLALRRQIFNNRLPGDLPAATELATALGGPVGGRINAWLTDRIRHEQARAAADALFETELARSRGELRRLAGQDRLRLGLLLGSPTLESRLDAYISSRPTVADKRERRLERSLLSYLYRTACKTSPFSTFTSVAPGHFEASDSADVAIGGDWSSHPRLNVVVLTRLTEVIGADPNRLGDLPIAPASGLELGDRRIRYVRRSWTTGDDAGSVTFDTAQDRVFFLRRRGILDQLLELLRQNPDSRCADVRDWLAATAHAESEEAGRYLAALLDLGMLQLPALATGVHDHDPLRAFQTALRGLGRPWASTVADRLAGPVAWIAAYPEADTAGRRSLLGRLRREILDIQAELGAETPSLPQILLYEDVTTAPVAADFEVWDRTAAEPLRRLSRVFPAFDRTLVQRLTLKGFFVARFGRGGRCDDLVGLVQDFHEDIFERYLEFTALRDRTALRPDADWPAEHNWLNQTEITAIDRARQEFAAGVRRQWAEHSPDAVDFVLDPATVDAAADHLASIPHGFEPQSYFLQAEHRGGETLTVLNNAYGGLCFPFTRFTHCFDAVDGAGLSAELRETMRTWQPAGAVFAEVTAGSATTNLNLHGRLADYEIVCPGETGTAAPEARLPLDDLFVEHDEAADRLVLRSKRLGAEVIPLYFGYLISEVLPEIPRTLLLLSPTFQVRPDVWRGVPQGPESEGVTSRPRVRYGDLVLLRRTWIAATTALPARVSGPADAEWFREWRRWRRRHGLPDQVFARILPEPDASMTPAEAGRSKPQYVDFDSPLSLLALDGAVGDRPARILFEEMLPTEDGLHVRSDSGRHVAEFVVELVPTPSTGRRKGHDG